MKRHVKSFYVSHEGYFWGRYFDSVTRVPFTTRSGLIVIERFVVGTPSRVMTGVEILRQCLGRRTDLDSKALLGVRP